LCTRVSSVVSVSERLNLINEVISILVLIGPVLTVASSNPVEAFWGIERCRLLPCVDLYPNLRCVLAQVNLLNTTIQRGSYLDAVFLAGGYCEGGESPAIHGIRSGSKSQVDGHMTSDWWALTSFPEWFIGGFSGSLYIPLHFLVVPSISKRFATTYLVPPLVFVP
jgi:hypothetical protein